MAADVLTLATAALVVDTATAGFLLSSGRGGERVREWYRTLRLGAYSMDVLSLVAGSYVAARAAPNTLWLRLLCVVIVQLVHDVAFGHYVKDASGPLMELFRRYADEMGVYILVVDALMLVATVVLAHALRALAPNDTAFLGVVAAYVGLLVVYSF